VGKIVHSFVDLLLDWVSSVVYDFDHTWLQGTIYDPRSIFSNGMMERNHDHLSISDNDWSIMSTTIAIENQSIILYRPLSVVDEKKLPTSSFTEVLSRGASSRRASFQSSQVNFRTDFTEEESTFAQLGTSSFLVESLKLR
jgi:hypothetical protein